MFPVLTNVPASFTYPAAIPIPYSLLTTSDALTVIVGLTVADPFVTVPPPILYIPTFPTPVPKFILARLVAVPAA